VDGLRWSGGKTSIEGVVPHFVYDGKGLSSLDDFGSLMDVIMIRRGRGRVVLRGGDMPADMVSQRSVMELQENLFSYCAVGGAEVWGQHQNPQKRWQQGTQGNRGWG